MSDSVVPRGSVATPQDVQKVLELTPEKLEEIRRDQLVHLYRSRAMLSPEKRRMARAIEMERHYRQTGQKDGLAEALKQQGRFTEAAAEAANETLKNECLELAAAVDREDHLCGCGNYEDVGDYIVPKHYVEARLYSPKHGREMPFIRCTCCRELNAMPEPQYLAEQRNIRNGDATEAERLGFFRKKQR